MITLLQIDKSGSAITEKDYSIVLIKNKKEIFGVNIPQYLKDKLIAEHKKGKLKIPFSTKGKKRFILRFHTAVIIALIKESTDKKDKDINIELCNDFDGHFYEIKEMIHDNISKIKKIDKEDIVQTKFEKPSKIDNAGKRYRNTNNLKTDIIINLNFKDLFNIIKRK